MTKADLIDEVSKAVEMTRKESGQLVDTIFESIVKVLRGGDKIEIRGFGSFRTRQRQARIGRNPKTGAKLDVPAKKIRNQKGESFPIQPSRLVGSAERQEVRTPRGKSRRLNSTRSEA